MPIPARVDVDIYLQRWGLVPDGVPIVTRAARLWPVHQSGRPAMLKITAEPEERHGALLMAWWRGDGAAAVLAHDDDALLLERATGDRSLAEMTRSGRDDEACRILCAVAGRLHAACAATPPAPVPLSRWFAPLAPAAARYGGILPRCDATVRALLGEPRDIRVLHGDLHHGNVLDFGARGWLAIDPKNLIGERGFDVANIFTNPDLDDPSRPVATLPGRFLARLAIVAAEAGLERQRLLRWILAWCGLSAAWFLDDGLDASIDLHVAQLAAAELDR